MPEQTVIELAEPPPSLNNLFVNIRGRGRVRSERYKTWLQAAGWDVIRARAKPMHGKVQVSISVGRSTRRSDIDNRVKPVLDLLVKQGVLIDDSQVDRLTAEWSDDIAGCRVVIACLPVKVPA